MEGGGDGVEGGMWFGVWVVKMGGCVADMFYRRCTQ